MALASTTLPRAVAPCLIKVRPPILTGSATVAANPSPALLDLELTVSFRRTVMTVPAGMVMTSGTGLVSFTGCTEALPCPELPAAALPLLAGFELSVEAGGVLCELLHPASTRPSTRRATTYNDRAFTITPSATHKWCREKLYPLQLLWL